MRKTLLCALLFLLTAAVLAVGVSALGEEMTAAYGTPTVDGTVDDVWASADRQPLKYVKAGDLKTDTYTLPDDLSVYASMLYDNTALYFLFEITDNEFAFNSTVGDWKNDCIYLYVDEVGDADPVWTPQQSQIALVPEDGFEMINPARKGTGPSSYQFAYTFPTATTCVIEFKYVPIDMSLKEGTEFMVDFQYNDSVEAATRDYCLGWSDESDNAANDAGSWGYVTLGKAGDAAAPAAPVDADATAAYAAKIPVIDGDIDDIWNTTEAMEAIMYENQEWTVEDLVDMGFATGYTKVLWREDTLYLLAVITDATMDSDAKSTTNGINFWVSETFSGNSDFNQAPGDWHIFCNADGGTNYYTGNKDVYNQAEMAAVRTSDGYIVEAAVPVLTADFEYSAGHKIGYNISVDDDSDADNNRDTFTSWQDYSGRAYWSDPSTLNEVALVAEGSSSGAAASGAELLAKSFDTIFVDGEMMVDGRANDWLAENPVEGDIVQLEVRGWSHLSTPITGYAYTIDGGTAEKSEDFIQDRPDVKAAIHEEAEGFDIQIDVSGLGAGDHLIKVFAIDADGGLVDTGFDFPFTMTGGAAPAPEAPAGYPASGESGNFMMGKIIGNETGWDGTAGSGAASAFDGNPDTFFDPLGVGDGFCGMEYDEPYILEKVAILSRSTFLDRFAGASIEGSNDGEEWETLWESDDVAPSATEYNIVTEFENNYGYKMFRYINWINHGDVAEVEFYGKPGTAERPAEEPKAEPEPEPAPAEEPPIDDPAKDEPVPEPESPTAETPAEDQPAETPAEEKSGCGSFVGGGFIVLVTVLGSAYISKRR